MKKFTKSNEGITLIALVVTIIVLLILAAVSIQMLTGDNGIITNASKVSTSNAYYSAEEQVKLAYMAVKAEISAKTVKSGTYDPTDSSETTALATIVANDLGANQTGSKWAVDRSTAGTIIITYTDSKIDKDSIGTVNLATMDGTTVPTVVPREEGKVHYKIRLLKSQDAELFTDISEDVDTVDGTSASEMVKIADSKTTDAAKTEYYQSFYGSVVDYGKTIDTSLSDKWKIFYIGKMEGETDDHIYLIADSYVKYDTLPTKAVGETTPTTYSYKKSTDWKAYFATYQADPATINDGILPAYPTGAMVGSSYATVAKMKNLNYKYYKAGHTGESQPNMRAVASMLDTNIWSSYMDSTTNGKAQYAIGGPTIEMLFNSYNQTHGTNFGAKAASTNGYQINTNADATTGWANNISNMLNTTDTNGLYVCSTGANAYWLASPSAYGTNGVMLVYYDGGVSDGGYNYSNFGFRPVVCLKSSVQLEKVSDNNYKLK